MHTLPLRAVHAVAMEKFIAVFSNTIQLCRIQMRAVPIYRSHCIVFVDSLNFDADKLITKHFHSAHRMQNINDLLDFLYDDKSDSGFFVSSLLFSSLPIHSRVQRSRAIGELLFCIIMFRFPSPSIQGRNESTAKHISCGNV